MRNEPSTNRATRSPSRAAKATTDQRGQPSSRIRKAKPEPRDGKVKDALRQAHRLLFGEFSGSN